MKALILTIITLALSSCSMRQTVLNRLDWFALMQIEDRFDLEDVQSATIEPELAKVKQQIKENYGPRLAAALQRLAEDNKDKLDKEELESFLSKIYLIRKDLLLANSETVAKFLATLTPEQIQHYEEEVKENDEDLVELIESEDFESAKEDYLEERVELLENWYGELNKMQIEIVERYTLPSRKTMKEMYDNRLKKRETFNKFLKEADQEGFKNYFVNWANDRTMRAKLAGVKDRNWHQWTLDYFLALDGSLSSEQRLHLNQELLKLANDLTYFNRS